MIEGDGKRFAELAENCRGLEGVTPVRAKVAWSGPNALPRVLEHAVPEVGLEHRWHGLFEL